MTGTLSWLGIVRLGLVQTALGAIVVLTTSTMNRVMVVELALPALLPGLLVAWHYGLQILRPGWGFGTDGGRRATPLILAGMAMLAVGGALSAFATAILPSSLAGGIALALLAFTFIGFGVGAAGTSLLALLARRVAPDRRAAAATIVWLMMIAGFVITAGTAGHFLDPFTLSRLVVVTTCVSLFAFILAVVSVWGLEGHAVASEVARPAKPPFRVALAEVWAEPVARIFAVFVFVSMLGYSAQDLILEPFAGLVFSMSPGETTRLSGVQNGGVMAGMVLVAVLGTWLRGRAGSPLTWVVAGCILSAAALLGLVGAGLAGAPFPIHAAVFALGFSNGVYAAAAIAAMMALAGAGRAEREGTRMGVFGAAQAIAFGLGGVAGAASVDLLKAVGLGISGAYGTVFALEALMFLAAAFLAIRVAALGGFVVPRRGALSDEGLALSAGGS